MIADTPVSNIVRYLIKITTSNGCRLIDIFHSQYLIQVTKIYLFKNCMISVRWTNMKSSVLQKKLLHKFLGGWTYLPTTWNQEMLPHLKT